MPKFEQAFQLFKDDETSLAVAYQAFKNLGWTIEFAGDKGLAASPPAVWKSKDYTVVCRAENGQLIVISESVNNQAFDLLKKNKKNTQKFVDAFNSAQSTDEQTLLENKQAIDQLRIHTRDTVEQDIKNTEEVHQALNLHNSNLYVTYAIIGINVLLFVLMVANGAGLFDPNGLVHIRWGSNYNPLTLSGDWWRLITNVFIHFGIIHLLMNMYCLYSISIYLEPFLGKVKFTTAYICTGVLASIVSLWWHKEGVNSAGASGAVFGMYGVFLALLTTKLVPASIRQSLLQSIGIFIAYNLIYGLKSGVDNAAHVGGLLSGFVIGYCFVPVLKKEKNGEGVKWLPAVLVALTVAVAAFYLQQNTVSVAERLKILSQIKEESFKDNERFNTKLAAFDKIGDEVYKILSDSLTNDELYKKIDATAMPAWQEAEQLLKETSTYDISPAAHKKAGKLLEYIAMKKQELDIIKQIITPGSNNTELMQQLNDNREKSNAFFSTIVEVKE